MEMIIGAGRSVDLCITLRCNASCRNCIKFCGRGDITGLDYSDSDMTMGQVEEFCRQVETLGQSLASICVTGGEPMLHPLVNDIFDRLEELRDDGFVKTLMLNTNMVMPVPKKLARYAVNYSNPKDNSRLHHAVFVHPDDFGGERMTYAKCRHYRKRTIVLNYQGYNICCAADGYIRLFCMGGLISNQFPLVAPEGMDRVCAQCPFGNEKMVPFERDVGCPVSAVYAEEAEKNRMGRQITKRFPERI
jgi:organic radical activating enzyme